jgi:PAS domain S-box-containing protein
MHSSTDLHALVAALGDAVVVCDKAGLITLWNPGAERLFGFSEAEALGASLDIIIPEKLRGRHWEGYHHTMATGITKYGSDVLRVPAITKDGRQLSIAFTVAMLYGPDGKVSAIASIMRDETDRFRRDRELRKRNEELERLLRGKEAAS